MVYTPSAFYGKNRCAPLPADSDVSSVSESSEEYRPPPSGKYFSLLSMPSNYSV